MLSLFQNSNIVKKTAYILIRLVIFMPAAPTAMFSQL